MDKNLISVSDAVEQGITRFKKPDRAPDFAHYEIGIKDGQIQPTVKLWSPHNIELWGEDPRVMPLNEVPFYHDAAMGEKEFVAYDGPLHGSDEYKEETLRFNAHAAETKGEA